MEFDKIVLCVFCKKKILAKDSTVINTKGLRTVCNISLLRGDGLHEVLQNEQIVKVHTKCRKKYTRKHNVKPKIDSCAGANKESITLGCNNGEFDFKQDCLFCGKATKYDDWKKHPDRFDAISFVGSVNFSQTVITRSIARNDEWGQSLLERISDTTDLLAKEAKYHRNCMSRFFKKSSSETCDGDYLANIFESGKQLAFFKLCESMENEDLCQFMLSDLHKRMQELSSQDDVYCERTLKTKLEDHFGSKVVITSGRKSGTIVTFRDAATQILRDEIKKESNLDDERMMIVRSAAKIIKEDIHSILFTPEYYPSVENVKNGGVDLVPETLQAFLDSVIKSRNGKINSQKTLAIAHAVISAVRPFTFVSPLQLGTAVYLHRKYRSRALIDIFNKLGFCSSYAETLKYESSVTQHAQASIDDEAFVQFVFDNADHNVCTVDGHGSFHVMGGIVCATPAHLVNSEIRVPRSSEAPSFEHVGKFGSIDVKVYNKSYKAGLTKFTLKDISQLNIPVSNIDVFKHIDLLWMAGPVCKQDSNYIGWSGYMETITKSGNQYDTSAVLPLPIVNLEPSNPSAVYTCLEFAVEQSMKQKQSSCIVTFDQPLYVKAMDIVLAAEEGSPLSKVIVRLGGFHLLMSFMGAVGKIMEGSGLEELWQTVFAKNSVGQMLKGHAYARALKAHLLTQIAVFSLIVEKCKEDGILLTSTIEDLIGNYDLAFQGGKSLDDVMSSKSVQKYYAAVEKQLEKEARIGRTSKLWIKYLDLVEIMRLFVRSERSGEWYLHLYCVKKMLPFLHAAGHTNYAKSAHMYLQQMMELESNMTKSIFEDYVKKGYFTVRRTSKFWSGIWSDMTIEQVLMKNMKSTGGLTRGHVISDPMLARWIQSMAPSMSMVQALEVFAGVNSVTSQQHVELGKSCQNRDTDRFKTFSSWLRLHSPFNKPADLLVSLSTGLVGDSSVNCDSAQEVGLLAMKNAEGKSFADVKLRRNDKVKPLSAMGGTVLVHGENVPVSQNKIFHRIACVVQSEEELKKCFAYELAPLPPSLFSNFTIRKSNKATLRVVLEKLYTPSDCLPPNPHFIIDGGHLLHRVVWPKPATFNNICESYLSYIKKNYGDHTTVVFDGYSESTTKDLEHIRRTYKTSSAEVLVDSDVKAVTQQHSFLTNSTNKTRLIGLLSIQLNKHGIRTVQAQADADRLIVLTAINVANEEKNTVIVGDDTDLLVLLLSLAKLDSNISMLIPSTKTQPQKVFASMAMQKAIGNVNEHLLFLHAMSGCDTTSAPYRKGKLQAFNVIKKSKLLREKVSVFNQANAKPSEIVKAGEEFLLELYGAKEGEGLNITRYKQYVKSITKKHQQIFDLSILPPTSAAAAQHSLRVYLQVQEWRGVPLAAEEWGWKKNEELGSFVPVPTVLPPAPDAILNMISCECKAGCVKYCGCKRNGLFCSRLCINCSDGCSNKDDGIILLQEEDEDNVNPERLENGSSQYGKNNEVNGLKRKSVKRKLEAT